MEVSMIGESVLVLSKNLIQINQGSLLYSKFSIKVIIESVTFFVDCYVVIQ